MSRQSTTDTSSESDRSAPAAAANDALCIDARSHGTLLALALGVLVASAVLQVRPPREVVVPLLGWSLPETCLTHRMTGLDCPGCGMTRSFIALAHFDLAAAWRFNAAGVFLFAVVLFQLPFRTLQLWRLRRGLAPISGVRLSRALWLIVVAVLAQWIGRLFT